GSARPNTWLAEIAFRVVSGRRRSARRKREDSDALALDHAVADAPGADARADSRQRLARVQRALETLDLTHRNVFVLFEIYGEPCDQIAAGLGIPVGTVYSRLHKARRQFSQAHAALTQGEVE
ncbi:MAG TPA: sigma factor-like helix-turn-helix DNA-binding protein, partial [Myxococcaceae bacterium]|nr:sigma factor-like helix-turn-helix DNA-binding protein [Myxococcaceae bacterium]